jgi:hypothetical protein
MPRKCSFADIRSAGFAVIGALLLLTASATRPAQAQSETAGAYALLHTFTNSPDGANPGALIQDAEGNLYACNQTSPAACCWTRRETYTG